jgi:hypothetical protein
MSQAWLHTDSTGDSVDYRRIRSTRIAAWSSVVPTASVGRRRTQLGARLLAEIGDDRNRFSDARALKAYAGSAPITRACGKKKFVGRRFVENDRLSTAGYMWGAVRPHRIDWHAAAQRNLFNRLLGQLHHSLTTRTHFDEATAFTRGEAFTRGGADLDA